MPQMAPMWWTMLMMSFIMTMITLMTMTYFHNTKKLMKNIKLVKNNLSWKWQQIYSQPELLAEL